MQKKIFIPIALLGFIFLGIVNSLLFGHSQVLTPPSVEASVLINQLQNTSFHLQMIYGSIDLQDIQVYDVTLDQFRAHKTPYTSFTEGFIPRKLNETLLKCVNQFRSLQNLEPISYYYHYTETAHYYFLSLSDGLDTLYIINKLTHEVHTPYENISYENASDSAATYMTEKQYVYHIQESPDALYVLTAKSNSYHAYLYRFDKQTFYLTDFKEIHPSPLAIHSNQYALSSNGTAFFVEENGLRVESLTTSYSMPLSFTPSQIHFEKGQLYALSLSEQTLNYALFSQDLKSISTGTLRLPNQKVHLLTTSLSDSTLYTLTYDPTHPLYGNYLTLYEISTGKILYCLALKRHNELALLDAHFISTPF